MRVMVVTANDAGIGRGDAVHVIRLAKELGRLVPTSIFHRGMFSILSGSIPSGTELGSVHNAYRITVFHALLVVWLMMRCDNQTVVYCRDWSVALVANFIEPFRGFKVVYEANSLVHDEMQVTGRGISAKLFGVAQNRVFQLSEAVVAVTERLAQTIRELGDMRFARLYAVPNGGVDDFEPVPITQAREQLGMEQKGQVVGFVGNLTEWQGLPLLLEAFKVLTLSNTNVDLLVVGDGPVKEELESQVRQQGLSNRVNFVGQVPHDLALLYICAFDVGVIPYDHSELYERVGRSPIKAYEYMSCGRPIVTGSFPGLGDEVATARCGIIVPPGDPQALAAALDKALVERDAAARMGAAGREYVRANRSWAITAREILRVCEGTQSARDPCPLGSDS